MRHPHAWAGGALLQRPSQQRPRSSSGQRRPSPLSQPRLEGDPGPPLKKYPSQG
ncbi:UNVERIFIED_CONTAM: hypothetical protein Slati_0470500 [Sesamum latifolium]|uniref:Uncharacterized protein n=1 Tax=Sesamum latifolium TaxID=2727402 RepID=A0AAW2Y0F5_9LAMI